MTPTPLSTHIVREAVARAIAEDLGGRGDVTSEACIPAEAKARFEITAREAGIVCGLQPAQEAFVQVSAGVRFLLRAEDGDTVAPGDVLGVVEGPARALLTATRATCRCCVAARGADGPSCGLGGAARVARARRPARLAAAAAGVGICRARSRRLGRGRLAPGRRTLPCSARGRSRGERPTAHGRGTPSQPTFRATSIG